jgi:hypothetical protein
LFAWKAKKGSSKFGCKKHLKKYQDNLVLKLQIAKLKEALARGNKKIPSVMGGSFLLGLNSRRKFLPNQYPSGPSPSTVAPDIA